MTERTNFTEQIIRSKQLWREIAWQNVRTKHVMLATEQKHNAEQNKKTAEQNKKARTQARTFETRTPNIPEHRTAVRERPNNVLGQRWLQINNRRC